MPSENKKDTFRVVHEHEHFKITLTKKGEVIRRTIFTKSGKHVLYSETLNETELEQEDEDQFLILDDDGELSQGEFERFLTEIVDEKSSPSISRFLRYALDDFIDFQLTTISYFFSAIASLKNRRSERAPKLAMKLMYFFLPKKIRDPLIGDLIEEFPEQVERLGYRWARIWVWKESVFAIINSLIEWVRSKLNFFNAVRKIGE